MVAVGSINNLKTEIYDDEKGIWATLDDYPFEGRDREWISAVDEITKLIAKEVQKLLT